MKSEPVFCNDLSCPCPCGAKPSPTAETDGGCWFCGRELIPNQLGNLGLSDSENEGVVRCTNRLRTLGWIPTFPKFSTLLAGRDCDHQAWLMDEATGQGSLLRELQFRWQSLGRPEIDWPECADKSSGQSTPEVLEGDHSLFDEGISDLELVGRTSELRNGQAEKPAEKKGSNE